MGRDKQVQSGQRKPMGIGKALVQNPARRGGINLFLSSLT